MNDDDRPAPTMNDTAAFGFQIAVDLMAATRDERPSVLDPLMTALTAVWMVNVTSGAIATRAALQLLADSFVQAHGHPLTTDEVDDVRVQLTMQLLDLSLIRTNNEGEPS